MENTRTITLHAQEIKKDKQSFIACSAFINNKWFKIKFTKECEKAPKTIGLYELTINFDDCSLERGKPYTSKSGRKGVSNDSIWVRNIEKIRKYTEDELKERNRNAMVEAFGEDQQLPF